MKVFTVRLARPVFQTSVIEVTAWNRASAIRKALEQGATIAENDWSTPRFDGHHYGVHVEDIIDNQKTHESSAKPQREIREFRYGGASSGTVKYMLLAADMKAKVGYMVTQPWFAESSSMLQGDLSSDWTEPLAFIVENDGLDNNAAAANDGRPRNREPYADTDENIIKFPVGPLDEEIVESSS